MLHVKRFKHWKLSLAAALILLTGLVLAACVPADLTANVAKTSSDVSALKGDIAAVKAKVEELSKTGEEPKPIERESKDQVIRGRADLLDYRMDYDAFKKSLDGKLTQIIGTPAKKGQQGKPDIPAKPGLVESQLTGQLSKLQATLAGTPESKDAKTGKAIPAKPGLLATGSDLAAVSKALADIKTQLTRIEDAQKAAAAARAAPAAPAAPAEPKP
ncbi:MAG: hypothetical protein HY673_15910 [Chloroflexi bacterium]|nr:hypothetical protein [Chloroflexota bacterium]